MTWGEKVKPASRPRTGGRCALQLPWPEARCPAAPDPAFPACPCHSPRARWWVDDVEQVAGGKRLARTGLGGAGGGLMNFFGPALPPDFRPFPLFGAPLSECFGLAASGSPVRHAPAHSAPFLHLHGRQGRTFTWPSPRHGGCTRASSPAVRAVNPRNWTGITPLKRHAEVRLLGFFRRTLLPA